LYLTVLDLYDRKIIGWSLSSGMSVEETSLAAWRMAIKTEASQREYFILTEVFNTPVKKFTNVVDSYKIITRSMSRKNCWDNAVAESFLRL
jgi:transposase InsO family protein